MPELRRIAGPPSAMQELRGPVRSFDQVAREGVQLFQIRYPSKRVGASLLMDISGEKLAMREIAATGNAKRRFWVRIRHAAGIESLSMEVIDGRIVRNLAAPDGTMTPRI
jgi:hypothetical protein